MTRTCYTLFRGGGGADLGLEAAGYRSIGGIEYDANIATVCDHNFPHSPTLIANICAVDPWLLSERPTHLHASPSCKNASVANTDAGEAPEDKAAGAAVERFLAAWLPESLTLENVYQYRHFDAFKAICATLTRLGYSYNYWHLNSADYGVPQTRKRLILLARQGVHRIQRPTATHCEGGDWFSLPWAGWYEAIKDLVPTLPASAFAEWQLARLGMLYETTVVEGTSSSEDFGLPIRSGSAPIFTLKASNLPERYRAFILDCQDSAAAGGLTVRHSEAPMFTVSATMEPRRPARAFLMSNAESFGIRDDEEPSHSITTQSEGRTRAWLSTGRVVKMTPRALARFQSFPDSYWLPEKAQLACVVIGNAVPPLLMQRVMESL